MTPPISRREFMRDAAVATAAWQIAAPSRASECVAPPSSAAAQSRRCDVLVIGAGASGLAAAGSLAAGNKSVIVLEARDRIGGRVWTNRAWSDLPVDLGASWIHGHQGNPLTELAARFEVPTAATDFASVAAFNERGQRFQPQDLVRLLGDFDALEQGLGKLKREFRDSHKAATSLDEAIRRWQAASTLPDDDRQLARQVARVQFELDSAANLDELAFPGFDDGQTFGGQQRVFPNGYVGIIEGLAQGLDIRLKTNISAIDYSGPTVKVATDSGPFEAERVIVTVPLGVLKSGAIRFVPELPEAKRAAIARLGMGLLNKVALRFRESFWPDQFILAFIGEQPDPWPSVFNLQRVYKQPLLVGFKSGRAARADERRTDRDLVAQLLGQLRQAMGDRVVEPLAWHVTRWASDPLAGGSYSFLRVGSSLDDRDALATPLAERVFFAGEATHRDHASTVHGAYLSGLREARRVQSL
jgi:monoamine oxidase